MIYMLLFKDIDTVSQKLSEPSFGSYHLASF